MFSCHLAKPGLDFSHTLWHEQRHLKSLACGPKLPRLKSSLVELETSRNSSRRCKTLAEKASPISTRAGPEQSCNFVSASVAPLAKNPLNSKSTGTRNSSWVAPRRRSRASHSSRPLLGRLSRRNESYKEGRLLSKFHHHCRIHQQPCIRR